MHTHMPGSCAFSQDKGPFRLERDEGDLSEFYFQTRRKFLRFLGSGTEALPWFHSALIELQKRTRGVGWGGWGTLP